MLKNSLWTNLQQYLLSQSYLSMHLLPEPTAVQGRAGGEMSLCSSVSLQCLSNSTASWQPLHRQMPTSKWAEKNYVLQMFPNSHLNTLISSRALCMDREILPVLRELLTEHTLPSQQDGARNKLTQSKLSYKKQSSATQEMQLSHLPFAKWARAARASLLLLTHCPHLIDNSRLALAHMFQVHWCYKYSYQQPTGW